LRDIFDGQGVQVVPGFKAGRTHCLCVPFSVIGRVSMLHLLCRSLSAIPDLYVRHLVPAFHLQSPGKTDCGQPSPCRRTGISGHPASIVTLKACGMKGLTISPDGFVTASAGTRAPTMEFELSFTIEEPVLVLQ